jgi:type II secretory pathway pseudopilin PulG
VKGSFRRLIRWLHAADADSDHRDRGAALIEAVFAVALVGVTAAALASVATAVLTQSRLSASSTATREIATQIAEQESALGCGLLTGAEPADILALAMSRCDLDPATERVVLGDLDRTVTRGADSYLVNLRYHWLPDPDLEVRLTTAVTCENLADGEPAAIAREVIVTALNAGPDSTISANATPYRLTQIESVPPDAAAYISGQGGVLVTGMGVNDAVDLRRVTDPETTIAIRRYGITIGADTCAWFPYLAPGDYVLGRLNGDSSSAITVLPGQTRVINFGNFSEITS